MIFFPAFLPALLFPPLCSNKRLCTWLGVKVEIIGFVSLNFQSFFFFIYSLGKTASFSWCTVVPTAAVSGVCAHMCGNCKCWTVTGWFLRSNQTMLASQIAGWRVWVGNGSSKGSLLSGILKPWPFLVLLAFPCKMATFNLGHFQNVIMIKLVAAWQWINTSGYLCIPIIIKKNRSFLSNDSRSYYNIHDDFCLLTQISSVDTNIGGKRKKKNQNNSPMPLTPLNQKRIAMEHWIWGLNMSDP